jgi:Heterokaryon incompatibility protein (HET)
MRLLERGPDDKISLTKNLIGDNIPEYAILSHTWGQETEEVTLRDIVDGTGESKAGYGKIRFCMEQTKRDGLQYFWIDTCCIDQSNSPEVSEAINSMFRWYSNAIKCYVYLADVSIPDSEQNRQQSSPVWEAAFRNSRWFTRGWTLQELLAPSLVEFFTWDGQRLGDKKSLGQQIHEITGIAILALQGAALSEFEVEERLKWAEKRETTREEDAAYCLVGIFRVFMSPRYGEGKEKEIHRLRTKIKKALGTKDKSGCNDSSVPAGIIHDPINTEFRPGELA